jgi:CBS domain containing-hemolysin-like protein
MSSIASYGAWLVIIFCIVQSALFAGLNLAVFSLSLLRLQVEADGGNADAAKVLDLRKSANQVRSGRRPPASQHSQTLLISIRAVSIAQ